MDKTRKLNPKEEWVIKTMIGASIAVFLVAIFDQLIETLTKSGITNPLLNFVGGSIMSCLYGIFYWGPPILIGFLICTPVIQKLSGIFLVIGLLLLPLIPYYATVLYVQKGLSFSERFVPDPRFLISTYLACFVGMLCEKLAFPKVR